MPRYKLTLAYDGTDFCGWQKQEPFVPEDDAPDAKRTPRPSPELLAAATTLGTREGETRPRIALRTVQAVVEQAVREVTREPVILMGASRTDSGVHARGQVAAFTCGPVGPEDRIEQESAEAHGRDACATHTAEPAVRATGWPPERGLDRLIRALNGKLPDDILVTAAEEASPDFNPIGGATSKSYSYTLHVSPPPPHGPGLRPLWDRRYVHHVWEPLDLAKMQAAATHLVGEYDFASFAASGHGRLTTVRTVYACTVSEAPSLREGVGGWATDHRNASPCSAPRRLRIDITGNGFLWNMVRIVAGTLVDVGRGRKAADDIPGIIAAKNRGLAGPTLPPTGLCLELIKYGHELP